MSRRRPWVLAFALLLALPAGVRFAHAWTDATRTRMLRDALKVTPPSMNAILARYSKDLESGMLVPSRHEDEEVHYQAADGSSGLAAAAVVTKEQEARAYLQAKHGLRRFAFEMGALAHLTSDVSFPLSVSDADPREPLYREAFRRFIETALVKIPFVLDTKEATLLETGDLAGHLMESARRCGANYALIGAAFNDDGTPRSRTALDERSVPFGVASLAYSQAVNDIVRVWERLWRTSGGDMSGDPYQNQEPAPQAAERAD